MNRTRKMPSLQAIREYWAKNISFPKNGFSCSDDFLTDDCFSCFACGLVIGDRSKPQRAHIKARCECGSDNVNNLHILCQTCHHDSEFISGNNYYKWFYNRTAIDAIISTAFRSGKGFNIGD